jgi:ankyrin repeat protein
VIDDLLQSGANVNPTFVCKTPLQIAVERGHEINVIISLLTAGADVNAIGDPQALIDDMTTRVQGDSNRQYSELLDSYCNTPLRIAEESELLEICDVLRENGAVSETRKLM